MNTHPIPSIRPARMVTATAAFALSLWLLTAAPVAAQTTTTTEAETTTTAADTTTTEAEATTTTAAATTTTDTDDGATPAGGADTGAGGTADNGAPIAATVGIGTALVAVAGAGLLYRRRPANQS